MPWRQATFKGTTVFAEVDSHGQPVARNGRLAIRYRGQAGEPTYQATAANVVFAAAGDIRDLPPAGPPPTDKPGSGAKNKQAAARDPGHGGFGKAGTRTEQQAAMASAAAQALVRSLPVGTVLCFTDGACHGNPGPAGSAAVLLLPNGQTHEKALHLGHSTNNVAELTGIGLALELLGKAGVPGDAAVAVFTDSAYTYGIFTKNWKPKADTTLIAGLKKALAQRPGLTLHWIAGHVGLPGNERADELATAACDSRHRAS